MCCMEKNQLYEHLYNIQYGQFHPSQTKSGANSQLPTKTVLDLYFLPDDPVDAPPPPSLIQNSFARYLSNGRFSFPRNRFAKVFLIITCMYAELVSRVSGTSGRRKDSDARLQSPTQTLSMKGNHLKWKDVQVENKQGDELKPCRLQQEQQ